MAGIVRWLAASVADRVSTHGGRDDVERLDADGDTYNYRRFRFWPARDGIQRDVTAGDKAVDATVYTLEGDPVELLSLWEDRPIVVEFGSITCPIFTAKVDAMDKLAEKYEDEVDFYVVYSREAHPGQRYHRHTSFDQKCRHARDAKDNESINRDILVDDVDGSMHRGYDALPNSVYVIGRDGVVAHRADWLDIDVLNDQLQKLVTADGRGAEVTPTSLEENYHTPDADLVKTMLRVHRRAGAGSFRDMLLAAPRMLAYRLTKKLRTRLGF